MLDFKPNFKCGTAMRGKRHNSQSHTGGLMRLIRRFSGDKSGVTAIEFGILGLPFFAMIAVIMETSVVFLSSNIFESALHDSVRLIRTGQALSANYDVESFRATMCDRTFGLFDCGAILINVREVPNFASANIINPIDKDTGDWLIGEAFSSGQRQTIMVAEAYYKWPTVMNIMGFNLATMTDGTYLMGAAEVFRNEPF